MSDFGDDLIKSLGEAVAMSQGEDIDQTARIFGFAVLSPQKFKRSLSPTLQAPAQQ